MRDTTRAHFEPRSPHMGTATPASPDPNPTAGCSPSPFHPPPPSPRCLGGRFKPRQALKPSLLQSLSRRSRERGAAFTFLPRAHLSAELSAAPVIGPRRSLVLGVNTAESEKTRAEPSPGASRSAQGSVAGGGTGGKPVSPHPVPYIPAATPKASPWDGCGGALGHFWG